ncbi:hypothetical protein BVI2075_550092 [Burkholderia vietnamiensis]|nr:hypothetical protein BVI2075_550092 [Burkholderia vietnamiensis]
MVEKLTRGRHYKAPFVIRKR